MAVIDGDVVMLTTDQAESTRGRILQAAYEQMYANGFGGLRIEAVLKQTQLAKGALYHYFPTKLALGYAVLDEFIMVFFQQTWSEFLAATNDPLLALNNFFQKKCRDVQAGECFNGCPLGNLIQEMSTLDQGFHQRFELVTHNIIAAVAGALRQGQADGIVRQDINPEQMAAFLLASYQGIMGAIKFMKAEQLVSLFAALGDYIEDLRVLKS